MQQIFTFLKIKENLAKNAAYFRPSSTLSQKKIRQVWDKNNINGDCITGIAAESGIVEPSSNFSLSFWCHFLINKIRKGIYQSFLHLALGYIAGWNCDTKSLEVTSLRKWKLNSNLADGNEKPLHFFIFHESTEIR